MLAVPPVHDALVATWREATHWEVGEYMIMPDHIHCFCRPGIHDYPSIRRWAGYWKRLAGDHEITLRGALQSDCWDVQMRTLDHFNEKLAYMRRNPERKGLVSKWDDWPYRGRVFEVHWQ